MAIHESRASSDTGLGKRLVVESGRTGPACWVYVESHQRYGIIGMREEGSQPCLLRGGRGELITNIAPATQLSSPGPIAMSRGLVTRMERTLIQLIGTTWRQNENAD
ncbi:hypothetical protein CFRS1_v015146 [Colletotrichum fructicola]|nr:hypothetical protein CFRS1_v015982 [Colletotrichum fructicola]KAF4417694.1 hypothetical protein CFRS1_v015146 [Colletotrichum fructicola]